jgi:hypothetical protein
MLEMMKKREFLRETSFKEERFSAERFDKSCLIYTKNNYGIFLVTGRNGENYTIKVTMYLGHLEEEVVTAIYISKKNLNMPNLLLPEAIYIGEAPSYYPVFNHEKNRLKIKECKNIDLKTIFKENLTYTYYITKACMYNLGYYLGVHKGVLTYKAFVAFSFQILAAIQSLHNIGVWHRDIKPQNILICNSDFVKNYYHISYTKDGKTWTINYEDTEGRDMKIIDYGESFVIKDITNPCISFEYEVTVATVSVFNVMWSKVVDKSGNERKFDKLIFLLKNCRTGIFQVLQDAEIYDDLRYEDDRSYKVNIF